MEKVVNPGYGTISAGTVIRGGEADWLRPRYALGGIRLS
jgi:hypothetical protein